MKKQKKTEMKLSELAKKLLEQPEVAPEPTTKPSKPGTTPKPGKPKWRPRTAPKPAPKAEQDIIDDIADKFLKLNEKKGKYSVSEMLSEINKDDIEKKFVGRGKVVSDEEFEAIMKATKNKLAIALWMIKRIEDDSLGYNDIADLEQWENYLDIFKRRKNQFPIKDINQIKTSDQVEDFVDKAIEIRDLESSDPSKKKGISKEDKYDSFKIGDVAGYKAYKIPPTTNMSQDEIESLYGVSCDLGSGTQWCTATGNTDNWFKNYSKKGPLYIFIGPDGKKYQFQYEGNDFMDKNDRSVLRRNDAQEATPEVAEFFKFLRDKEKKEIPLKAQFAFTPESIDWEGLAYDENDLNLIKDTDNIENIVWDKVDQGDFNTLRWVIQNSPENIDPSKIDINRKGVVGLLAKDRRDAIDWDKYMIDSYVKAMSAVRYGGDDVNWNNIDYSDYPTLKILSQRKPEVIDKSKVDMSNAEIASIFS